ncbi:5-carboxymethyl-2-hydroxymuconate isomerase [Pseudohalocynthiibacter aestuariivivens]|nr:5-carboxymethyl-2-hydroxymuconate isomerase [Pseudohalocynthiibacter aestuariivivens]QIE46582.1 5-carboxymethyl-2-hydroxymuconate isomerase [Pseudohalocynthiibacter aestuariivivens]
MPHVMIDHSADVGNTEALNGLCQAVFDVLATHPSIPNAQAIKVRTLASGAHRLGSEPQSYAHATLLLLPGRSAEVKADLANRLLQVLSDMLPQVGSLSVNLGDLDPAYAKRVL